MSRRRIDAGQDRAGSAASADGTEGEVHPPYGVLPPGIELVGRGAFMLARCRECDWEGPARRSSNSAVADGTAHAALPEVAPPGA